MKKACYRSLLTVSAPERLLLVIGAIGALWTAVAWACAVP